MTLWLHVHGGYPSYEGAGTEWNRADWDAFKFAKALKGEPFKGYADIRKVDGSKKRISAGDPSPAFEIFGAWGAQVVAGEGIKSAWLIPVPASGCVEFDTDAKGRKLCDAIAKHHGGTTADEAFCWTEPMQPAHKGGPRKKQELLPKLRFWDGLPKDRPVILVDDVATLHGHMRACAHVLREQGYQVGLAIAGAQTVHDRPEHGMFDFPAVDLDAEEPAFDWDF